MALLYSDLRQANSKWTVVQRNQTRTVTRVRTDGKERDDDAEEGGKEGRESVGCMRAEL